MKFLYRFVGKSLDDIPFLNIKIQYAVDLLKKV